MTSDARAGDPVRSREPAVCGHGFKRPPELRVNPLPLVPEAEVTASLPSGDMNRRSTTVEERN